jgi:hypothetical protein
MQKIFSNFFFQLFVVVCVLIIPFRFLLHGNLFESDDYELHAARTANYYLALSQGQFPPRWAPNLNNGFGYPSFNYMYPLPYFVASVLHMINFSIQESLLLSILLLILAGGIGAYLLSKPFVKHGMLAVVLAAAYFFNPYTFLLVYWRGAIGELFLYCLIPYILLCIYNLYTAYKSTAAVFFHASLLSFFVTAAILSHVPSMIPLSIICAGWLLTIELKQGMLKKQWKLILSGLAYAAALTILLSSFYLFPAVLEKNFIAYEESNSLLQYIYHFIPISSLLDITRSLQSSRYFLQVIQLGIGAIGISLLAGFQLAFKKDAHHKKTPLLVWSALFIFFIFFMTNFSKFIWDHSELIIMLQFPWRLLWVINVCVLCMAIELLSSPQKQKLVMGGTIFVLVAGMFFSIIGYGHPKSTFTRSDYEWYESYITGSSYDEHRPKTAKTTYPVTGTIFLHPVADVSNPLNYWRPLDSSESTVNISQGTTLQYVVDLKVPSVIVHKRLFFPGWTATVDGKAASMSQLATNFIGLIQLELPAGRHEVKVHFDGKTPIRTGAEYLSLLGGVLLMGTIAVSGYKLVAKPIHSPRRAGHFK